MSESLFALAVFALGKLMNVKEDQSQLSAIARYSKLVVYAAFVGLRMSESRTYHAKMKPLLVFSSEFLVLSFSHDKSFQVFGYSMIVH